LRNHPDKVLCIFSRLYFLCYLRDLKTFCKWCKQIRTNSLYMKHYCSVQWLQNITTVSCLMYKEKQILKYLLCSYVGLLECDTMYADYGATQCHKTEGGDLKLCWHGAFWCRKLSSGSLRTWMLMIGAS
jgi:hypothetical protein